MADQRSKLALVLPVLPSAGLKDTIFGALGGGGGGAAAAASGGAAGGAALSGGGTTAGLAAKSLGAKLAIGAALAGGAGGGAAVVAQVTGAAGAPRRCEPPSQAAPVGHRGRRPAVARRGSAGTVLVDSAGDNASATGTARREAAAERRRARAHDRRVAKRRREEARAEARRERAADKQTRVAGREQAKQDRAVAKQQRTAERQDRLAARPVRGNSGSGSSGTRRKHLDREPRDHRTALRRAAAPRSSRRRSPAPTPVLEPVLTPARGKSDAAKGRAVEEIVP